MNTLTEGKLLEFEKETVPDHEREQWLIYAGQLWEEHAPALISMARRTREAEERLEKAVETSREALRLREQRDAWRSAAILGSQPEYDFQHDIDSPTNWKLAMDHAWSLDPEPRASLVRPKAIRPPQECAPPEGTDVPPAQSEACKHGTPFRYHCTDCEADDDAAMKAMRKGLDDHSCNSTGWEK